MGLQTDNLVMIGLGSLGDIPQTSLQPALKDGIHLRWSFKRAMGFPWYGFYLFRRPTRTPEASQCFSEQWGGAAGNLNTTSFATAYGTVSSDKPLAATDEFAPAGVREFNLGTGSYLRVTLAAGLQSRRVQIKIGFKTSGRVSVKGLFGETAVAQTSALGQAGQVTTLTLDADTITAIELSNGPARLIDVCFIPVSKDAHAGWETIPGCPYPLRLPVTQPGYPCTPGAAAENLAGSRSTAQSRILYGPASDWTPAPADAYLGGTVSVANGSPIVLGANTAWNAGHVGTLLAVNGQPTAYTVSAVLSGQKLVLSRPYGGPSAAGAGYKLIRDQFGVLHDQLAALVAGGSAGGAMAHRMLPAPAASAGTVKLSAGMASVVGTGTNWSGAMIGLSFQAILPTAGSVAVINGSTSVIGSNTNWAGQLKRGLLRIAGDPTPYRIERVDGPDQLTLERPYSGATAANKAYSVLDSEVYQIANVASATQLFLKRAYNGPSQAGVAYQICAPLQAQGSNAPLMQQQHPLDLALLAALHPAVAQMLGLYWVDQEVVAGTPYDYLLVADYKGDYAIASGLKAGSVFDPAKLLNEIATKGFGGVEACIVFGKKKAATAALPAPTNAAAYALPDNAAGANLGSAGNGSVGLRWNIGVTSLGTLLPDRPVAYHLWRADLGADPPAATPATSAYAVRSLSKITGKPQPVLVSEALVAAGAQPQRPQDWPPFPLFIIDNKLADGWYSYRISGIDLFGRHSPLSAAAQWSQWGPQPEPRPWYYKDPAGAAQIHPYAVRLLDKTPPPAPTGVEAFALDPQDSMLLKDAAYLSWFASLSQAEQDAVVGLRVRWQWPETHAKQAPDTQEFRIYFNAGSKPPAPDHSLATNWQQRFYVVGYNQHVSVTTDEDGRPLRVYEVILPAAGDSDRAGLPLAPSAAMTIAYGLVGVSAADNKAHSADAAKWAGTAWGDRPGNEGRVGAPAKIYRVHRVPPGPPAAAPADSDKVFATAADYHGHSFFSYRWVPENHFKTHILRAMDETLFLVDWAQRPRSIQLSGNEPGLFPTDPRWNANLRGVIAGALNKLDSDLAPLKNSPTGFEQALVFYRALSNDALRVLASLPGNERAFVQLTINPLDPADPNTADRRGLDDPPGYQANPALRVYLDTLDGRASNRYLYRALYVDGAHNRGAQSVASPPVWLPDVVPPAAPVLTKLVGGDRQITLSWASNREADLAEYRVYRTAEPGAERDLRLMTLAGTVAESAPPAQRPATVTWTDTPLPGGLNITYRVVAVDGAGNASAPSRPLTARAYDKTPPAPPAWGAATRNADGTVALQWSAAGPLRALVERSDGLAGWRPVSGWLAPGASAHTDLSAEAGIGYVYRLRVQNPAGLANTAFAELEIPA